MGNTKYEQMAERLFFKGGNIIEVLKTFSLELKDGKTTDDFKKAFHKGIAKGRGKFEREMFECGLALEKVCKEVRESK